MTVTDVSLFAQDHHTAREKSATALRTISEASEMLDVPQHVLRFWETKFNQIKPLKRNGGRRFYRPQDIEILQQIKHLLYAQGYTIKGAKKAIDDFAHGKQVEWLNTMPAANGNDNDSLAMDPLAEIAQALCEDDLEPQEPKDYTEELRVLRAKLLHARHQLTSTLKTAA